MRNLLLLVVFGCMQLAFTANAQRFRVPKNASLAQADSISAAKAAWEAWWLDRSSSMGRNIIRIYPIYNVDLPGIGFGMDYERIIGKHKSIGLVLPIHYEYVTAVLKEDNRPNTLFISPGIKFYPKPPGKFNWAFGANVFFGQGSGVVHKTYWFGSSPQLPKKQLGKNYKNFRLGIMTTGFMNLMLSPHVCFGLEAGLGVRMKNTYTFSDKSSKDFGPNLSAKFALGLGMRF